MPGDSQERYEGPTWDIMLSYRRKAYASIGSRLADLAQEAGLRCWLDVRNIDQRVTTSTEEVRSALRLAAENSRIVVGFMDEDALVTDPATGSSQPAFNWRLYEHQFAREFVWLDGSFLCSFPDERIPFYNLPHLAYYLALACDRRSGLAEYWETHLDAVSSVVRYGIRLVAKYHEMPTDYLPPIIHPELPGARRNAMPQGILLRGEIDPEHKMDVFE